MSAARKPRPIGPQAVAETAITAQASAGRAEASFNMQAFIEGLSPAELMDLDEVANGAIMRLMGHDGKAMNLKVLYGMAWIHRRRADQRLRFEDVRNSMSMEELADFLNSLDGLPAPKADSATTS